MHPPVLLAVPDLIPHRHHLAAHSVQQDIMPLPAHRVLSAKLAALLLKRDPLSVRNALLDLSLVLERRAVVCALLDC